MHVLAAAIVSLALASGASLLQPRSGLGAGLDQEDLASAEATDEAEPDAAAPDGGSEQA